MSRQINILLTGAEGYVGGLVFQQLEILSRYYFMNPSLGPNIFVRPVYLVDQSSINPLISEKFDFVFHCAVVGGRSFDNDEPSVFHKNIEMFNLLKQINFNKFIHFTSAADLGRNNDIFEELPEKVLSSNPIDYFGKSKNLICNEIIRNKIGINLRIFNVYGRASKNSNNFIDIIYSQLMKNEDITIYSDRFFDFFFIENLRLIITKIINDEINVDYNLVHKQKYKISDYVNFISRNVNSSSQVKIIKNDKNYTGKNSIDITELDSIDPFEDLYRYIKTIKTV